MKPEHERFDDAGWLPPWVAAEHLERYEFAAGFARGKVVVDCACGSGLGTLRYARAGAERVLAFDVEASAVERTARRCSDHRATVVAAPGDVSSLPLTSDSIDVFVCLETIEHVEDDRGAVREIARVLRPGGVLVCSTPNRALGNPAGTLATRPINPFHVREYTEWELRSLLSNGLVVEEVLGQGPRSPRVARLLDRVGRIAGSTLAARLNQVTKLPRLVSYDASSARVVPMDGRRVYDYFVAVCRKP